MFLLPQAKLFQYRDAGQGLEGESREELVTDAGWMCIPLALLSVLVLSPSLSVCPQAARLSNVFRTNAVCWPMGKRHSQQIGSAVYMQQLNSS